jgi:hypothetical protein
VIVVTRLSNDEDIRFLEGTQFNNSTSFVKVRNTPSNVDMHNMQSRGGEGGGTQQRWFVQGGKGVLPGFVICVCSTM